MSVSLIECGGKTTRHCNRNANTIQVPAENWYETGAVKICGYPYNPWQQNPTDCGTAHVLVECGNEHHS